MNDKQYNLNEMMKQAPRFTSTSPLQKKVFDNWIRHNGNNPLNALAFDTETTGLDKNGAQILHYDGLDIEYSKIIPFGISLAIPYQNNIYLFWGRLGTRLYDMCQMILKHKGYKVAHNIKYDWQVLQNIDAEVKPANMCTLVLARLLLNYHSNVDLKTLGRIFLDLEDWEADLKAIQTRVKSSYTRKGYPKGYSNYSHLPNDIIGEYAMCDVFATLLLHIYFRSQDFKWALPFHKLELTLARIINRVEDRGVKVSQRQLKLESRKIEKTLPLLTRKVQRYFRNRELKVTSPAQLLEAFISKGVSKKLLRKKGETRLSTDRETLETLAYKTKRKQLKNTIGTILEIRSLTKIKTSYLDVLLRNAKRNKGIVYASINPTDTRTGRMTVTKPALQTIPQVNSKTISYNPVRICFTPRTGFLNMYIDYSQMEMWVFAFIAREHRMLNAFKKGLDIHQFVADTIYGAPATKVERQNCKKVNFGIIYGMGDLALAQSMDRPLKEAKKLRSDYFKKYQGVERLMEQNRQDIRECGYVEDFFERRYFLPISQAYKATNRLVQGSCATILKQSILKIDWYLNELCKDLPKAGSINTAFLNPLIKGVLYVCYTIRSYNL
jgi:DNA polymerase-1